MYTILVKLVNSCHFIYWVWRDRQHYQGRGMSQNIYCLRYTTVPRREKCESQETKNYV